MEGISRVLPSGPSDWFGDVTGVATGAIGGAVGGAYEAWIIDVIAPFGAVDVAIKDVRERVFAGRKIKTLQPAPDGKGMAVVEW